MGQWKVGFAKRVVTPPLGVALAGYGLRPHRTAGAVLDDLYARALVFEDGQRKAALITVDVITIGEGLARNIRARIEKETGIPSGAILISAVHSHSTPAAAYFRHWGEMDPPYVETVQRHAAEAAIEAHRLLAPAALGWGEAQAPGIAINRVRKDGPVDATLHVLGVRSAESSTVRAAAMNFACHPVCMETESRFVSGDYPGRLVREFERDHPGSFGAFFQGALGDINPAGVFTGVDAAQNHGRTLAGVTRQVLEGMKFQDQGDLAFAQVACELPLDLEDARREALAYLFQGTVRKDHAYLANSVFLREWAHETLGLLANRPPDRLRCEVQALRIGELAIVGLPGEIYTLIGQAIRSASPFPNTWVVGFANGVVGYVADPRDYPEETYAAALSPKIYGHPPFMPHAWQVLVDAGIAALKKL